MRGNNVNINGNLTRDAEVRSTNTGKLVIEFGIAWNDRRKNQQTGQYEDVPHYFDCFAWVSDNQLRSVQPKLVRGAGCAIIDGSLDYQAYTDRDGNKRSRVRIKVNDPIQGMRVEPPTRQQPTPQPIQQQYQPAQQPMQQQAQYQQYQPVALYDEDIPF